MTGGRRALAAAPTPPAADPLTLAAADLRDAVAEMREVTIELRDELARVRAERRAHAELVAERDRLIGENHEHQKAILLLLDQLFRTGQHAADPNGSTNA